MTTLERAPGLPDVTTTLFAPVSRRRMLDKGRMLATSAVILDLEDGVGGSSGEAVHEVIVMG